jgi:tRNA (guanosine-2'-O-)-methyltransferase
MSRPAHLHSDDNDLLAFLAGYVSPHKLDLFDRILEERTRWITLVLENVYREHNASACLRTSDAFGLQDVHVVEDRVRFRPDGEVALGASKWLTLERHADTAQCLAVLRERGYRIVATSPRAEARPLDEFDVNEPVALLLGTERQGLTRTALDGADDLLRIPMYGFTASFNLSVSAALCLHHFVTRLRRTEIDWRLTHAERDVLRREWIRAAIGPAKLPAYERRFAAERAAAGTDGGTR